MERIIIIGLLFTIALLSVSLVLASNDINFMSADHSVDSAHDKQLIHKESIKENTTLKNIQANIFGKYIFDGNDYSQVDINHHRLDSKYSPQFKGL